MHRFAIAGLNDKTVGRAPHWVLATRIVSELRRD